MSFTIRVSSERKVSRKNAKFSVAFRNFFHEISHFLTKINEAKTMQNFAKKYYEKFVFAKIRNAKISRKYFTRYQFEFLFKFFNIRIIFSRNFRSIFFAKFFHYLLTKFSHYFCCEIFVLFFRDLFAFFREIFASYHETSWSEISLKTSQ